MSGSFNDLYNSQYNKTMLLRESFLVFICCKLFKLWEKNPHPQTYMEDPDAISKRIETLH